MLMKRKKAYYLNYKFWVIKFKEKLLVKRKKDKWIKILILLFWKKVIIFIKIYKSLLVLKKIGKLLQDNCLLKVNKKLKLLILINLPYKRKKRRRWWHLLYCLNLRKMFKKFKIEIFDQKQRYSNNQNKYIKILDWLCLNNN